MILALIFLSCAVASSYGVPANNCNDDEVKFIRDLNNNFGAGFLKLFSEEEDGNIFFSPSSLSSVLSAISIGARGRTAEDLLGLAYLAIQYVDDDFVTPSYRHCIEILKTLRSKSDEYTLERANAILVEKNYPILQEYKYLLAKYLGSIAKEVDFSGQKAINEVNQWVREKTHGKISKLVDELDENTRLLLLSAIYFNGTWQTEFDPENTKSRPFYNNGITSSKSVPTMELHSKFSFFHDAQDGYQALLLPYNGDDVSMLILLPSERDGLERLLKGVSSDTIPGVLSKLQETDITVYLPKFKIEYSKFLKDALTKGGLGALFSQDADFSGITGGKDLYVSDVVHKAVVEVNEQGTEAAAITGGIMVPISHPMPNLSNVFNADHPFLFFILDNRSASNLFVGLVKEL